MKTFQNAIHSFMTTNSVEITVKSDFLSDGSRVWGVLVCGRQIDCMSERHALKLAADFANSINENTNEKITW